MIGFLLGIISRPCGQVVTYLTILVCMDANPTWGWRAAFRFPMLPMILMIVVFGIFFKEKPEDINLKAFKEEDEEAEQAYEQAKNEYEDALESAELDLKTLLKR